MRGINLWGRSRGKTVGGGSPMDLAESLYRQAGVSASSNRLAVGFGLPTADGGYLTVMHDHAENANRIVLRYTDGRDPIEVSSDQAVELIRSSPAIPAYRLKASRPQSRDGASGYGA